MILLDFGTLKYIPQLNITYNTKAGDSVLFEYSCQIRLDPIGGTSISIYFEIDGTTPSSSHIYLYADSAEDYQDIYSSGITRYCNQSSAAGEHNIQIYTWINEDYTNSWVRFSVLTVSVF